MFLFEEAFAEVAAYKKYTMGPAMKFYGNQGGSMVKRVW